MRRRSARAALDERDNVCELLDRRDDTLRVQESDSCVAPSLTITSGGTAASFVHLFHRTGGIVIPAGGTVFTVNVPIVDDALLEGPESFPVVVELAAIVPAPLTATVTILDDDGQGGRRSIRH